MSNNDNEIRDRMTRVESRQTHHDSLLERLIEITDRVSVNVSQLVLQKEEHQKLEVRVSEHEKEIQKLKSALFIVQTKLEPLEGLPNTVARSDLISNVGLWVASTLFIGFVSLGVGILQGWVSL